MTDRSPKRRGHHVIKLDRRQVFWLTDHPTNHAFSAKANGDAHVNAAGRIPCEWHIVAFVPDYSGGSAVDSHHLPRVRPLTDTCNRVLFRCQRRSQEAMAECYTGRRARVKWKTFTRITNWGLVFVTSGQRGASGGSPPVLCAVTKAQAGNSPWPSAPMMGGAWL